MQEVAAGSFWIGLGQISEILANKDVALVGPVLAPVQGLATISAGSDTSARDARAAAQLNEMPVAPPAKALLKQAGFM